MIEAPDPLCLWILEDDAEIRSVMMNISQHEGFNVLELATLAEFKVAFSAAKRLGVVPVGILADFYLKDGNSEDLLLACRKKFPQLPVFCISGGVDWEALIRLQRSGIEILGKPIGLKNFLGILSKIKNRTVGR
jgi:DNA-binding NtrC family response regulator